MTFDEYQRLALETAVYPNKGKNFVYPALGLCGEAGEYAEKIKKLLRDKDADLDNLLPNELLLMVKELGDVLWYVNACAYELGYSLEDVAQTNIDKLLSRKAKKLLHGSGDDR